MQTSQTAQYTHNNGCTHPPRDLYHLATTSYCTLRTVGHSCLVPTVLCTLISQSPIGVVHPGYIRCLHVPLCLHIPCVCMPRRCTYHAPYFQPMHATVLLRSAARSKEITVKMRVGPTHRYIRRYEPPPPRHTAAPQATFPSIHVHSAYTYTRSAVLLCTRLSARQSSVSRRAYMY